MPAVLIRNLSAETHKKLKRRAKLHGSSTEAEIRLILDEAVRPKKEVGLGTQLQEIGKKHGAWFDEFQRDPTPLEPADFD
jgi:plasmid stability protein